MKKKYFYLDRDYKGQRTGHVCNIELSKNEVEKRNGFLFYKGVFLYEKELHADLAAQS
jgi:hypothetical protein